MAKPGAKAANRGRLRELPSLGRHRPRLGRRITPATNTVRSLRAWLSALPRKAPRS